MRKFTVFPATLDNKSMEITIRGTDSLIGALEGIFDVIGVDYFFHPEQLNGVWPPEWFSLGRSKSSRDPLHDSVRAWRNISFYAREVDNYILYDLANRIGFGLQACEVRLRDLSESYHRELLPLCTGSKFESGRRVSTLNTFTIYLAVHAFLSEACSLRDHMAEFISIFAFPDYETEKKITVISSLRKYILKKIYEDSDFAKELYEATSTDSPNGWLAELGEYRDLTVHSIPIGCIAESMYVLERGIKIINKLNDDKHLPSISLPLPKNPSEIFKKRTKGDHELSHDEFLRNIREKLRDTNVLDALDYCQGANNKIIDLSRKLLRYSPVKSSLPIINLDDLS